MPDIPTDKPCPETFGAMAEVLTCALTDPKALGPPVPRLRTESVLETETANRLRSERDRLRGLIDRDRAQVTEATSQTGQVTQSAKVSDEAIAVADRLTSEMTEEFRRLGFEVETRTAAARRFDRNGVLIEAPEHRYIEIKSGTAKGPLARELRRIEREVAARLKDPNLPESLKGADFGFRMDPLSSEIRGSIGTFSYATTFGRGFHLSAGIGSMTQAAAISVLRHELRHMKIFFDLASGRPTPYRITFQDKIDKLTQTYTDFFSAEEVEGFKANVRSAQARLGRATEVAQKQIDAVARGEADPSTVIEARRALEKEIENTHRETGVYLKQLQTFIESSMENTARARTFIADPSLSDASFQQRMSVSRSEDLPGIVKVTLGFSQSGAENARIATIAVPEKTYQQGLRAVREHITQYLVDFEKHLFDERREFQLRHDDYHRDANSRLSPPRPRATPNAPSAL